MQLFVKQLSGEVTKQDRLAVGCRLQFVQQVEEG